ncbi:MAG TPA: ABC transporter substrate-binding protein [Stellaceae bacterium]|nr:ABC transporter substrate-binding protein [Stellaceae bacterium]
MLYRPPIAPIAAFALTALLALPGHARDFTDSAGRRVMLPDHISRVVTAGPTADVMVYALAPRKLVGWSEPPHGRYRLAKAAWLRVTGLTLGPDIAGEAAIVSRLHPDVVIAAGAVTPARAALIQQLQQQSGVPCILVADSVSRIPDVLRAVGSLLGVDKRAADLATYAEHAIDATRGRLLIQSSASRPRVYYARGFDGLETALPGSPAGDAIDQAGAINVAALLGRGDWAVVTPQQVAGWAPDIIIAQDSRFYRRVQRDPLWRNVPAVREHHVYLEPSSPFGWVDDPPGINRLIGLYWLTGLFYPDPTQEDLRDTVTEFYKTFYGIKLTSAQADAIVKPAVAPHRTDPMEALLGIGTPPSSALPPGMGLSPMTVPTGLPGSPRPGRRGMPPTPMLPPAGPTN